MIEATCGKEREIFALWHFGNSGSAWPPGEARDSGRNVASGNGLALPYGVAPNR